MEISGKWWLIGFFDANYLFEIFRLKMRCFFITSHLFCHFCFYQKILTLFDKNGFRGGLFGNTPDYSQQPSDIIGINLTNITDTESVRL